MEMEKKSLNWMKSTVGYEMDFCMFRKEIKQKSFVEN